MAKPKLLRVAVVDDHELMRDALVGRVNTWGKGQVVLQAVHGLDYEKQCTGQVPVDMAIVDLSMPFRDGFETTAWIKEHQPGTKVLVYTFDANDANVHHALRAGADGVLSKEDMGDEVVVALEALRTSGRYVNDLLMRQLTHVPDPGSPQALRRKMTEALSPRELEVGLLYVGDDSPSRVEIAERLDISQHTVEAHRRGLVEKTGARTRVALLKCFLRFGLVKL